MLNETEWTEGAIECTPAIPQALEAASLEGDGTLIAWNGAGEPVEISVADRARVTALLLQGRIRRVHTDAIRRATDGVLTRKADKDALLDLFTELVQYVPPVGYDDTSSRLKLVRDLQVDAVRSPADQQWHPKADAVAVMWTVSPDLVVTSVVGEGDVKMRAGVALAELYGTDDPTHFGIAAHKTALAGTGTGYFNTRDGVFWNGWLEPVRDENGKIYGVIGYAVAEGQSAAAPDELAQATTTADGLMASINPATCRLFGFSANAPKYVSAATLMREELLDKVIAPKEVVKNTLSLMGSAEESTHYIGMKDGRVIYRYGVPVKNGRGTVIGRVWYFSDATHEVTPETANILGRPAWLSGLGKAPAQIARALVTVALAVGAARGFHRVGNTRDDLPDTPLYHESNVGTPVVTSA